MVSEKINLVHITEVAIEKFKTMLLDAGDENLYLKLSVAIDGTQMHYNIDTVDTELSGDKIYNYKDLKVLINEDDEELLSGAVIDYIIDDEGENIIIDNPNLIQYDGSDDGGCCGRGCCFGN
ncbi:MULTISPECIES: iron-sulfur cluster assembly accessory protein [unclassified Gemella]|uniref:HesB/IscA family protein n=1 Tax=unclassified Gemella TaxID=2624949 RepID=UPI001C04627C|nr:MULTISPECIES: iron-sulfur cluster assembly accessory protein [unclassified Gemella]MBU0278844.1 iron-sulfur cluster assembly accessory protein [Gemella sp. zg-1178]QWQ39391.1 iron-sulfur cluster assembly accessory protein [Gemella sp. zg-570]